MATLKVIRTGQPATDVSVEVGQTLGEVLSDNGFDTNGVALVYNGSPATPETIVMGDSTLLLAGTVKGGIL